MEQNVDRNNKIEHSDAKNYDSALARIILVDTNCFLRLYQSPVLPFLGRTFGGFRLLTLHSLIQEFLRSKKLMQKYAWLEKTVKTEDLEKIAVNLSKTQQDEVKYEIDAHIEYANSILNSYCSEQNIFNRQMSRCDCELLATGIVLDALIATDEWPFNFVVEDLLSIPEEGYKIKVITSLHILHLLEQDGSITANDRRNTIRSWLQNDEKLRSDWRKLYRQLFKEKAPTL